MEEDQGDTHDVSTISSRNSRISPSKRSKTTSPSKETVEHKISTMVSSVISAVREMENVKEKQSISKKSFKSFTLEDQSIGDLMSLIDKHQNYMQFLQNNEMLDEKRKNQLCVK